VSKADVLVAGNLPQTALARVAERFAVHRVEPGKPVEIPAVVAGAIRGICRGPQFQLPRELIEKFPKLEIVASFGVGYEGIDLAAAAEHGIIVTNTPDVLTEEVADTALALLLMAVRGFVVADRYLRAGRWANEGPFPLSSTLRDRTVGILGLGRIGLAIARRLDAMQMRVVYHSRNRRADVAYRYYPELLAMAADVDTLIAVLPGTPEARHVIDAAVLKALGPAGVLVNVGRGAAVDEAALIAALRERTILAAGLDVFENEPRVPEALIALDNAVLLPHLGSASVHTRNAMGQLCVDNLVSWFESGAPLTPVPETPVREIARR
jgi:lactate dehydrogenase-like 2-hydroxyacid dehydrogenase